MQFLPLPPAHWPFMLKAVLFDAAETLIRPWPSYGAVYARVTAAFGMRIPAEFFAEEMKRAFRAVDWPLRTTSENEMRLWQEVTKKVYEALPADLPFHEWFGAIYQAFASADAWVAEPGAAETLQSLRDIGIRTAVVSNWDERLMSVLDGLGLAPLLDRVFVAAQVGWRKPAREIFLHACRELDATPGETLHIGDSASEDVSAARAAGLQALHYRPSDPTALRRLSHVLHSAALVGHTAPSP
ncbi:MAG: Phosphoglycolate phosphatase prokaryotic HAD-superfamily [Planctomycetota bacterium]|nr:MAG: Phosphoglycolate phosphatase prokaryotic HAD-superfamily [Planctomycetota bacterium]